MGIKDHAVGGVAGEKPTIVAKVTILSLIFNLGWFFLLPLVGVVFDVFIMESALTISFGLMIGKFVILAITGTFNKMIIFDDDGLTERVKIFSIYEKSAPTSWSAVSYVNYQSMRGFYFYYKNDFQKSYARVFSYQANYRKCLKYAVQKLPPNKFSKSARKKLEKIGVWEGSEFKVWPKYALLAISVIVAATAAVAVWYTSRVEAEHSVFTDARDSTVYKSVKIGNIIWMAENLNYPVDSSWCYENNPDSCAKYGRLYTWDAAKIACSGLGEGWRLPDNDDWEALIKVAGGLLPVSAKSAGIKLKSKTGWQPSEDAPAGTDEFGFSALPGGWRNIEGNFNNASIYGIWWSVTGGNWGGAKARRLTYRSEMIYPSDSDKNAGCSVRCIRDD